MSTHTINPIAASPVEGGLAPRHLHTMANNLRRPSLVNRAVSTPPSTPRMVSASDTRVAWKESPRARVTVLTPPTSPRQSKSFSTLRDDRIYDAKLQPTATPFQPRLRDNSLEFSQTPGAASDLVGKPLCLECPYDVEILKDERNRSQMFGQGAWSTVYRATTHVKATSILGLTTPPNSPIATAPALVAVKKPARRDAPPILENEARILTYLVSIPESEFFIVPFYGRITANTSIVLAAIPTSLDDYIKSCAQVAREPASGVKTTDPVIGSTSLWLQLALRLVLALDWLHNEAEVVHGDIKPGNILLAPKKSSGSDLPFEPVFADFTSGQLLNADELTPNTLSAVTREYTAPELLSSAVLRNPKSTATTASDVFSMAVTLLVAATGETMVYPGSMFQRQAMATQGWQVLSHVRNGDQGTRVPRFGIVERVLERAVLKAGMGRMSAAAWRTHIKELMMGEPSKV